MSQSYVNAIAQDRQGFIWLGTQEGLNRYDGYRFRLYEHRADDPGSLGSDLIRTLTTDATGTLWVGTDGGGLARYEAATDSFVRYQHDPADDSTLPDDRVRMVAVDDSGMIWVGTDEDGVARLDPATGRFERFALAVDGASGVGVFAIGFMADGEPIVGTTAGLIRVDTGTDRRHVPIELNGVANAGVRAVWIDPDDAIWVGTAGQGLVHIAADGSQRRFHPDAASDSRLSHGTVNAIRRASSGELWVGTENGLDMIEPGQARVVSYGKSVGQLYGLPDANIQSIFEDEAGLLWVGTFQGASYWDTLTASMQRYSAKPGVRGELPTNNINGFAEDGFGRVWVATRDRGVIVLDTESESFVPLDQLLSIDPLPTSFVTTMTADRNGAVWIGSRRSGLLRVLPRNGTVEVFRHTDSPATLSGNAVSAILQDEAGEVWVAAFDSGLNRFDAATGNFVRWVHEPDDPASISSNRILVLCEGGNGILWLGHWRFGVDRLNTRTGRIDRVSVGTPLENALVQFLAEDDRGDLWIGTASDGLYRWRAEDIAIDRREFERFTERHGLPSATIYNGVFDQRNNLWLGTGNGLSRLDPDTLSFENYDTSHGLLASEFTFGAAYASREGRLYFGSDAGFNAFFPEEIRGNAHPPKLAITAVRKRNQPVDIAPLLAGQAELSLTHEDYLLEFEVAGLDFAAPERNRYQVRLDGLDDGWLDLGEKRSITYTNLEPGPYVFRARAANNYGVWSSKEARLAFDVLPAPWATWWAYLLYAVAAIGVITMLYRARAEHVRAEAAALHAGELESINTELKHEVRVRREKETALEREKRRAETYFNVAEVVLVTLDESLCIKRVNDKGQRLLGVHEADILSRSWTDFVAEAHQETAREHLAGLLGRPFRESPADVELPMIGEGGEERLFVWRSAIIESADDEGRALFLSGMDVTRMRALEKQMRLREKMNAIGTLAGGIAHDFNNILQAIYGFTTLALENMPANDEKSAYLKQVVKGADRARNLVKRILTFSNQKEYDLQAVDIGPVVNEACALLRGSLPATVEIGVDLAEERHAVSADPTRIHQIVMNLGTNAAQAMSGDGGKLAVSVASELVTESRQRGLAKLRPALYMTIRVRDTGIGMTAETQEHIFDPFFTTKDTSENTGLGLTVVHGIVRSHGGEVFVDSEPGRGTVFTVYLPVASRGTDSRTVTPIAEWRGTESILLVDDEEWVLTVTRKILEAQGYRVSSYSNGTEALAFLAHRSTKIDLVVTDETMPKMTGSQFIRAVHKQRPKMPAIIISGKLAPAAVSDPLTWFLQKPFTAPEINEKVRYVLDEVRGERRRADAS